jgi:hypothetical protein
MVEDINRIKRVMKRTIGVSLCLMFFPCIKHFVINSFTIGFYIDVIVIFTIMFIFLVIWLLES